MELHFSTMASFDALVFVPMILMFCVGNSALRIDIDPAQYTEETGGPVNISCHLDSVDTGIRSVILLQVLGPQGMPVVSVEPAKGVTYGNLITDNSMFQSEGMVAQNVTGSYLILSLLAPTNDDGGVYTCKMYFTDGLGYVTEHRDSANLIVDSLDVHMVVRKLLDRVSYLENKLQAQDALLQASANIDSRIMDKMATIEETVRNQTSEINRLDDAGSSVVTFSAQLTTNVKVDLGDVIVFPRVIMNEGQGYDVKTGVFNAPKTGLYAFHVALTTANGAQWSAGFANLVAKGNVLSTLIAQDTQTDDQSSVSAVSRLQKGDGVKVVMSVSDGGVLWHAHYSFFTGYLIRAL